MFLITTVLFSAIGLATKIPSLTATTDKGLAPILRTAKLNYEIEEDVYSLGEFADETWISCGSISKTVKTGTVEVPVYDLTNGGGMRSAHTAIEIESENPVTLELEKIVIDLSTVIANLKSTNRDGTSPEFRKFFASNAEIIDPTTQKPLRTQGLEVFTDNLDTKLIEGWIGVQTPDPALGDECKGRGFSIWVSFEDIASSKTQN